MSRNKRIEQKKEKKGEKEDLGESQS